MGVEQLHSDADAIRTLYWAPVGVAWEDTYRRAIADMLYMMAWLEDRARFGMCAPTDWRDQEVYALITTGPRGAEIAAAAIRAREQTPRPRRTAVDDRLAYYADLRIPPHPSSIPTDPLR